jgi:hypothetical protein
MYCEHCGHNNSDEANFCSSCGAAMSKTDTPVTITFSPVSGAAEEEFEVDFKDLSPDTGVIVVKRGPNPGQKFILEKDAIKIGRHPKSDIFLDDITVSRRHAEIKLTEDGHYIKDEGSLNGTYLNRERIDEAKLRSGDEIQIGKFKLIYFYQTAK